MGLVVAELETRFTADTSQAESGITNVNGLIDTLKSTASGGIAALEAFGLAGAGLRELGNVASELADALGITLNARVQQISIALQNLGMTTNQTKAYLDELQQFANVSPFSFMDLVGAGQRMLALGINGQQVLPILKDVAAAVGAVGGTKAQIDQITYALTEMANTGVVNRHELRMLANDGVPIFKILGDQIGVSTEQLLKMTTAGELSATTVIQAFDKFAKTHWMENLVAQSQTFSGAMATIQDTVQQVQREAFAPLFDELSKLVVGFANVTQSQQFGTWAAQLTGWVQVIIQGLNILVGGYASAFGAILEIVVSIGQMIYAALSWINPFARHSPSLVEQVNDGTTQIAAAYAQLGAAVPQGIGPAIAAIDALKTAASSGMATLAAQTDATMQKHLALLGKDAPAAYETAKSALAALETQAAGLNAQIAAAEAAMRPYEDAVKQTTTALNTAKQAMTDAQAALRPLEQAQSAAELSLRGYERALHDAEQALRPMEQGINAAEEVLRKQEAALRAATHELDSYQLAVDQTARAVRDAESALRAQEATLGPYEAAARSAAQGVREVEQQVHAAEMALRPFQAAVRDAQAGLNAANDAVKDAQEVVRGYQDQLRQATSDLRDFTQAPLQGQSAFSDQIFANKQQVAQLQLQLNTLQMAGAPEAQTKALRDQIERLRLAGENLNLTESLQFDPLRRQLEQIANPVKELTFDEARTGAQNARTQIDTLTPALARAQQHLDAVTNAQRAAQSAVDAANAALQSQTAAMQGLNDALQDAKDKQTAANDALTAAKDGLQPYQDAVTAAKDANQAANDALSDAKDRILGPYQAAIDAQKEKIQDLKDAYADAKNTLQPYQDAVDAAKDRVDAAKEAVEAAKDGLAPYQTAIDDAQAAVNRANDALQAQKDKLQPLKDEYADLTKQMAPLKTQMDEITRAADQMASSLEAAAGKKGKKGKADPAEQGVGFGGIIPGIDVDALKGSGDFQKTVDDVVKNASGGLKGLQDGINGVVKPMQDVADLFHRWAEAMHPIGPDLSGIVSMFGGLIGPLGGAVVLLASLGTAVAGAHIALALLSAVLGALLSPIGLLITGTTLLLAAWQNNFGGIRTTFGPLVDYVMQGARLVTFAFGQGGLKGALDALPAAFGQLPVYFQQGLNFIGEKLDETVGKFVPWREILNTVGTVVAFVRDRIMEFGPPIAAFVGGFAVLQPIVGGLVTFIGGTVLPILEQFKFAFMWGADSGGLIGGMGEMLFLLVNPITLVVGAVVGLVALFVQMSGGFDNIIATVRVLTDAFGYSGLSGVFGLLNSHMETGVGGINMLKGVFQAVWPAVVETGRILGALAQSLGATFGPMIAHLGEILLPQLKAAWIALQPSIGTLWQMFQGLMPVLGAIAGIVAGVLIGALGGLIGLVTGIVAALPNLVTAFGNVLNILHAVLDFVGNFVGLFINFFVDLYNGVVTGHWEPMWNHFKDSIGAMGGDILALITNLVSGIVNLFLGLATIVANTVKGIWDAVVGFFTNMWNDLVGHSIVPDMVNAIITWFGTLGTRIGEAVNAIWTNVVHFFTQIALDVVVQVIKLRDQAMATFDTFRTLIIGGAQLIWNNVVDKIKQMALDVVTHVIQLRDDATNAFNTAKNNLIAAAQAIWTGLTEKAKAIALDVMVSIAKLKLDFETTINNLRTNVTTAIQTLWTNITNVFKDAPTAFVNIGHNMVQGLINGLNGAWGTLTNKLHDLAMQLPEPIRNALGIHSPSEETHDLGTMIAQGLQNGITQGFARVQQALQSIAQQMLAWGQQIATMFTDVGTVITQRLTTMGTQMQSLGTTMWTQVAASWVHGLTAVKTTFLTIFGEAATAGTLLNLLMARPDGFFDRLDDATNRGLDYNRLEVWQSKMLFLHDMVMQLLGKLRAEAGAAAVGIGQAISQGIANGIQGAIGEIAAQARAAVEAAISEARAAADAHSPSVKAATMVGLPLAQGIGMGIQQGTSAAVQQMVSMVAALLGVPIPAFPGMAGGGGGVAGMTGMMPLGGGGALGANGGSIIIPVTVAASITDPTNPSAWEPAARAIGIALQRRGIIRNTGVLVTGSSSS